MGGWALVDPGFGSVISSGNGHFTLELLGFVVMVVCQVLIFGSGEVVYALHFDSYPPLLSSRAHTPGGAVVCHRVVEAPG